MNRNNLRNLAIETRQRPGRQRNPGTVLETAGAEFRYAEALGQLDIVGTENIGAEDLSAMDDVVNARIAVDANEQRRLRLGADGTNRRRHQPMRHVLVERGDDGNAGGKPPHPAFNSAPPIRAYS